MWNSVRKYRAWRLSPARTPAVQEGWRAVVLASVVLLAAAAPSAPILLREQAWTPAGETLAYDMTHAPAECAIERTQATEIGRALFRSPELTHRVGAADVTSEWSSKTRGDGVANPVDIPDLGGVSEREVLGHVRNPSLESFVHGVIVEEFQGHGPPAQAFDGMMQYLRGLQVCDTAMAPVTLADAAEDVRRAVSVAESADAETARLVLLAAQDAMGRIVERLPARQFSRQRSELESLSRQLGAVRSSEDVQVAMQAALPGWRARFDALITRLARHEPQTYFNEGRLRRALAQ
jgi:hypothetical protein